MTLQTKIEKKMIEWKGKTLASSEHFESELRESFESFALLVIGEVEKRVLKIRGKKELVKLHKNSDVCFVNSALSDILTSLHKLREELEAKKIT